MFQVKEIVVVSSKVGCSAGREEAERVESMLLVVEAE